MTRFRIFCQLTWSLWKQFRKFGFRVVLFPIMVSLLATPICFAKPETVQLVQLTAFSSLTSLPDASMAMVTGRGLKLPSFDANAPSRAAVVLWDEIRPQNLQQRFGNSGTVIITVNGDAQ